MTDHPIIFSAPMIHALREGRKTQTRRTSEKWAKMKPGDLLWVKTGRFMPRRDSPITLEVTGVKVERLQDISEEDALAEGCQGGRLNNGFPERDLGDGYTISSPGTWASASGMFALLWDSIHGDGAWDENPLVYAITFNIRKGNIDGAT